MVAVMPLLAMFSGYIGWMSESIRTCRPPPLRSCGCRQHLPARSEEQDLRTSFRLHFNQTHLRWRFLPSLIKRPWPPPTELQHGSWPPPDTHSLTASQPGGSCLPRSCTSQSHCDLMWTPHRPSHISVEVVNRAADVASGAFPCKPGSMGAPGPHAGSRAHVA